MRARPGGVVGGLRCLALGLVLALAGCSLFSGGGDQPKPKDLGPNVPVLGVRQVWSAKIGPVQELPLAAKVHGNTVTLAAADGTVAAIDARTGGDVWRVALGAPLSAAVGGDGQWTAVVSRDNELIVLDAGRELWRKRLGVQVFTAPLVAGGRVFVLASDRAVSAWDAKNGARLWNLPRPGEPLVLRQQGVLLAVGDTLVVGQSGRLVGMNPDNGTVRWEAPLASSRGTNDVERLVELIGPASRAGDVVCVRAFQASVGCVNAARGSLAWTQKAGGGQAIGGSDDAVFGTEGNGTLVAWRRSDGTRLWSSERLQYRRLSAPLALGRSVVVGDETGVVHLLSREDGAPLNRMATDGSAIAVPPVVAADTLIVVTRNGSVLGYRPE